MTLQSIRDGLAELAARTDMRVLLVSLVLWTAASTANAMVDLGAVLHDAACLEHAGQDTVQGG